MAFIDEVTLNIHAGSGGNGVVRWRREKFKPKMGPGGGDGGHGGNVYAVAIRDLAYMESYRYSSDFKAEDGGRGDKNALHGANGKDLELKFPIGTILTNTLTGEKIELTEDGQRVQILKGGRGGFGNEHFKSSTNTTPYEWTPGQDGEYATFEVELQLFADIGLIGIPSAGKSTLLNELTNAQSKVAAYHFTTLEPHLGAFHGYILADIPGIIEGASEGKGLGFKFLRHIRRTEMIAHLVSCEEEDPAATYRVIRGELEKYGNGLNEKNEVIILSKTDLVSPERAKEIQTELEQFTGKMVIPVTAFDDESLRALGNKLIGILEKTT